MIRVERCTPAAHGQMTGDAIHAIWQMLAGLGFIDPHLTPSGKLEF
jgi:hypothetical protein